MIEVGDFGSVEYFDVLFCFDVDVIDFYEFMEGMFVGVCDV